MLVVDMIKPKLNVIGIYLSPYVIAVQNYVFHIHLKHVCMYCFFVNYMLSTVCFAITSPHPYGMAFNLQSYAKKCRHQYY